MTVAVVIKVHDGVALAADSASTLVALQPDGTSAVVNVYDNANKIVNLIKGLPLGIITWGSGSIGSQSITSIYKDLRLMLSGQRRGPRDQDWTVDRNSYTVAEVANRVSEYVYSELYEPAFAGWRDKPALGMVVAGYSSDGQHAEEFSIEMGSGLDATPVALRSPEDCGLTVCGQPDSVYRLVTGVDPGIQAVLEQALGVPPEQSGEAADILRDHLALRLMQDAMPFQDALDLADFFVDLTIRVSRFAPGPATVGGPIELAGITRHEGFKWIKRKHYYDRALNS